MPNSTPDKHSAAPAPAQSSRSADLKRRRFLFTLGAGGAGAAVAVSSALPGTAVAQVAEAPSDDRHAAYRATDHVRDYYRTTKL